MIKPGFRTAIQLAVLVVPGAMVAQRAPADLTISVIYTGRSLGALGVLRAQDEHELITEQANTEGLPFRLVSHSAWRAPGIAIFLPSDNPEGDELPALLAARATAERIDSVPALRSGNALLVQDPHHVDPDLLAMLRRNPRAAAAFPDIIETRVTVYRLRAPQGQPAFMIEEEGAIWPDDPTAWTVGEMNRIIVGGAQLFELPLNIGEIGSRATVLRGVEADASRTSSLTLVVDLGERDGDLGIPRTDRARIDYTALTRLGYSTVVPYELELGLGAKGLAGVAAQFPGIRFLAANVRAKDSTLFEPRRIIEVGGVKLGLLGLVDPNIRAGLPRSTLADFVFSLPEVAARREAAALRLAGADAVVALSNLDPADNAVIASRVTGIDAIVADLHVRSSPENVRTEVRLPDRPRSRPGSPALVARGFANGLGVGRLDLNFHAAPGGGRYLASLSHLLTSVTDRIRPDTAITREIRAMAQLSRAEKGDLMFPSFTDLIRTHPALAGFDETTKQGRVSQRMWEEFVARLLRNGARAEIAVIRKFSQFPPLIGKLHEDEVRGWLWTEDQIVVLDLRGADFKKFLAADGRGELVVSGADRVREMVMGRRIDDDTYYRIATTDVLYEGARAPFFEKARRVRRGGALREFVLAELHRLRSLGKGDEYLDRMAARVAPDPPYENLLTFAFERPTLWTSLNRTSGNEAYGQVPESRVTAADAWVLGASGRFKMTYDRQRMAADVGLTTAYARQSAKNPDGLTQISESADDVKLDLTFRKKVSGSSRALQPFVRGLFDTEFTPTVNPTTQLRNPRQEALRGSVGLIRPASAAGSWRTAWELAAVVENDFGQPHAEFGFQGKAEGRWPIGRNRVLYLMRNDLTWFLPSGHDTQSDLALRYNMVHELLIPLVDELSLSVGADFYFFRGKVPATRTLGSSMLLRVGLAYDRIWKPRYQPLF